MGKNKDLKKLALLGLASSAMMATAVIHAEESDAQEKLPLQTSAQIFVNDSLAQENINRNLNVENEDEAFLGFNGLKDSRDFNNHIASNCGGKTGCGHSTNTSYQPQSSCGGQAQWSQQPQSSCGGQAQWSQQPQSSCGGQAQWSQQPQSSCGGQAQWSQQPQSSCGGQAQWSQQPQSSCGGQAQWSQQPQSSCGGQAQWSQQPQSSCGGQAQSYNRPTRAPSNWHSQPQTNWSTNQHNENQRNSLTTSTPTPKTNPNDPTKKEPIKPETQRINVNTVPYYNEGSIADATRTSTATATKQAPLTETTLQAHLNAQGKATYQSLSPEGKALALKLANQDTYKDKNEAVKAAAQKSAEKKAAPAR